jgi:tRNA-(ms[2]io[6]A)-hydroxylase
MGRLQSESDPSWLAAVLGDFDAFLQDHANCERKAAATAMSLVSRHAHREALVDAMLELAQEELAHFQAVFRLMCERKLPLVHEERDPYINALRQLVRTGRDTHPLDSLLVAGVVEARGCERFGLIADALPEGDLKAFYQEITRSEARHGGLFVRFAKMYFPDEDVDARLSALFAAEADIIAALPPRAALH